MKSKSNKANNNNLVFESGTTDDNNGKAKENISRDEQWFSNESKSAISSSFNVSVSNMNGNSFRILTYNLWCHRLVGGWHSAQRLNTFAAWLLNNSTHFYDIICLQEVFTCNPLLLLNFGSGQRTALIEAVKCKYPYNYTANVPWFGVQDSGCLVLSAHKIEPCYQEPFNDYSLSELVTHKGYMCCKITIASKDLIVINTHLRAGMKRSAAIRARQLQQIYDHITIFHAGHRVILCGDLNIEHGGKEYMDMLKSLSVYRLMDSSPRAAATYARLVRLDYILINQYFSPTNAAVVSADEKNQADLRFAVSDHEGLEVTLQFSANEPLHPNVTIIPQSNKSTTRQLKVLSLFITTLVIAVMYFYVF